jgi:hypothetical protein
MSDDRNKWGERPKPITLESVMAVYEAEVAALREQLAAYKGHSPEVIERRFAEYDATAAALRERAEAAELALRARLNEQPLIHSAQAAARAAEARASLLEELGMKCALLLHYAAEGQPVDAARAFAAVRALRAALDPARALPPTRGGGNEGRGTGT